MMAFLSLMGLLVGHCKPQYCVLWAATQPSGHHVWHGRQRMNARESSASFLFTVVRVCIGGNSFSCVCLVVRIFRLSIRSLWLLNCNSLLSLHRNGNAERRMKMRSVCAALILRWVCVCVWGLRQLTIVSGIADYIPPITVSIKFDILNVCQKIWRLHL